MSPQRSTMAEIARRAGVSVTTVSLALRGHPRISPETRDRIRKLADELSYRRDAKLSELMNHLRQNRFSVYRETLAFVNILPQPDQLDTLGDFPLFFRGVVRRAEELGYAVDRFDFFAKGMTGRRLSEIVAARGIRGVVVGPTYQKIHLRMEWQRFCAVVLGHTFFHPRLHGVSNNQYHTMAELLRKLLKMGYQRPALILHEEVEKMLDFNYSAAFRIFLARGRIARIEPFLTRFPEAGGRHPELVRWIRRVKPDAIIGNGADVPRLLGNHGIRVPEEMGFFDLCANSVNGHSGINQRSDLVGEKAVEQLASLLFMNQTGVPAIPSVTLLEGVWRQGWSSLPHSVG